MSGVELILRLNMPDLAGLEMPEVLLQNGNCKNTPTREG